MKKFVLIMFLLALAVTGVFAQSNTADADLRKELHAYIDAILGENLYALRSLLALLAEQPYTSNRGELHEVLDSIPERNIEALIPLLQALADPSYNTTAGIYLPQPKSATDPLRPSSAATTNAAVSSGFSVGGGVFFDWSLKNSVSLYSMPVYEYTLMSIGMFAFFDTKYVELSIGPSYGIGNYKNNVWPDKKDITLLQLDVSILGKIPVDLSGGQVTVFPLLGLSYNYALIGISGTDGMGRPTSDLGQLGILGGAGLDYNLSKSIYLRGEGFFHFRLPLWSAMMDAIGGAGNMKIGFGMGPRVKLGVGYRF